jgi:hypothetical protein
VIAVADRTPTDGARFVLEREREDGASAIYRVTIHTPDATFASTATLREDGGVELTPTGAPGALESTLVMFAKLTARAAAKKREDGLPPWPARVTRWRGPGRGE